MTVKKLGSFVELAKKQRKHLVSIPLKDRSSAKVLFNDKGADVYVVRNGVLKPECCFGFRANKDLFIERMACLMEKLQKVADDGVDVFEKYADALLGRFVK